MTATDNAAVDEAAELIISRFRYAWAYFCQFRFALTVCQRALMRQIPLRPPSLEIGINDGSSATIAQFGKPKFTYGGDMPEASTFESKGLHLDPNFDVYEHVVGMDAHAIPFPDGSFHTIVTNDMLSYGLDRSTIVREMVRVLAPGGTLVLTETSGNLEKYPHLMAELRTAVPTVDVLQDPVEFYRSALEALGMIEIRARTWLDHRLCAVLYASLRRGETTNPIDDSNRGFYEESLRALAGLLADDLGAADDGGGWQVFVSCRKPGQSGQLATPQPVCLACRATLKITLDACACPQCGRHYHSELGHPYILANYSQAYSPKHAYVPPPDTRAIEDLLATLADRLQPPATVSVFGFDKSTRYMIRFLESRGIAVSAIYTDNPIFAGHDVLGVPIRSHDRLRVESGPIVMSLFGSAADAATLAAVGSRGTVHQPDLATMSWSSV